MIGGFTLASWGTLGQFWDTGEHTKGHFEVQAWIFNDFLWILVPMEVIWHACASTLASWGTLRRSWGDPGTLEGTRKDQFLKPDSRDPATEIGNLETEKRVHRIHDTLETGLQIIPRSLVAPTRGAGGLVNIR